MDRRGIRTFAGLPETYFTPREGSLVRVTAFNPRQLRALRTELELLHRINRRVESCDARPAADLSNRYSDADRMELSRILDDASHPVVVEMIDLFDSEFPETRKDIMMSVVNDESDNIVQEAAEAGVINVPPTADSDSLKVEPADDADSASSDQAETVAVDEPDASSLTQALSEAEEAMDETVKLCQEGAGETGEMTDSVQPQATDTPPPAEEIADTETPSASDEPSEAESTSDGGPVSEEEPISASDVGEASVEAADALGQVVNATDKEEAASPEGAVNPPDSTVAHDSSEPSPEAQASPFGETETQVDAAGTSPEPAATEAVALEPKADDETNAEPAATAPEQTSVQEYTAERAAEAVETIERGIRTIAATLQDEVVTRWKDAKQALTHVAESGQRASETRSEIEVLLDEIKQLRDKARSAMEDLTQTQQQARLLREDALRAKERAEASASAAESAADQASREAQHAACPAGTE